MNKQSFTMRHEDSTVITQNAAPVPKATEARTPFCTRVKLMPAQKLTRAHLAASQRPAAMESLVAAAARIAEKLGTQLKTNVTCNPSMLPSTLHPFSHLSARSLFVTLELGGESLAVVELDALGVGAILGCITGGNEPVGLPTRLSNIEEAALGWVVLATLAEIRKESLFSTITPRLVSMTLDRGEVLGHLDGRRRHIAVQLDLRIGQVASSTRILVPALWVQSKIDALALEQDTAMQLQVGAATIPATCIIGSALLPDVDADALGVGDVVLFPGVTQQTDGLSGPGRIVTPTFELRGAFGSAGFTLTRAFERPTQESTMSSHSTDPSVPVEIEVELTRLRVPIQQLGSVRPGSVIPLHINAAQTVVIRIGDRAVARAELVEIEGEIGARIISML